jgi:hypothetical protein
MLQYYLPVSHSSCPFKDIFLSHLSFHPRARPRYDLTNEAPLDHWLIGYDVTAPCRPVAIASTIFPKPNHATTPSPGTTSSSSTVDKRQNVCVVINPACRHRPHRQPRLLPKLRRKRRRRRTTTTTMAVSPLSLPALHMTTVTMKTPIAQPKQHMTVYGRSWTDSSAS